VTLRLEGRSLGKNPKEKNPKGEIPRETGLRGGAKRVDPDLMIG